MTTVTYHTTTLSEPSIGDIDHAPVCRETYLKSGGLALQGSTRIRRAWSITCLTDDHTEIDALDALMGQKHTLTIDSTPHYNVMIRAPFREKQVAYGAWQYEIGFVQERLI